LILRSNGIAPLFGLHALCANVSETPAPQKLM